METKKTAVIVVDTNVSEMGDSDHVHQWPGLLRPKIEGAPLLRSGDTEDWSYKDGKIVFDEEEDK